MCQPAAFDMIRVISQLDLHFMIDPARNLIVFFQPQPCEDICGKFPLPCLTSGLFCIVRDIPCLTRQKRTGNTPV